MTTRKYILLAFLIALSLISYSQVTMSSLLDEMVDRDLITMFPEDNYKCLQFSSYDRRSTTPEDASWFANDDQSWFIRTEHNKGRKEYVMFDAEGPGAVVRVWMTGGGPDRGKGILRIYVDGQEKPVVSAPAFEWISKNPVGYPLSASVAESEGYDVRGHNLYLPIPYSKSCKITYQSEGIKNPDEAKKEMFYYNINYRQYDSDIKVTSFSEKSIEEFEDKIKETNKKLIGKGSIGNELIRNISLLPKKSQVISVKSENRAIRKLAVKINNASNLAQQLRSTIIKISFDGITTVEMPLGDFFGTVRDCYTTESWYVKIDKDTKEMTSYFVMPFQKDCNIEFKNYSKEALGITVELQHSEYAWSDRSMYFGASWFQKQKLSTGQSKLREGDGGCFDLNYVTLKGKGVYVADALSIFNPILHGHWKVWWGEGDEKIYIDGEDFPSHFGTGTEDYYGYAWCRGNVFEHPYIAQPIGEGNLSTGLAINLRHRALDAIPFHNSLKLDMEMWHWSKTKVDYAATTYYYAFKEYESNHKLSMQDILSPVAIDRYDVISSTPENGILEGEDLIVEDMKNIRGEYIDSLSGGLALRWDIKEDHKNFEGAFIMDRKGTYDIEIHQSAANIDSYKLYFNETEYDYDVNNSNSITVKGVLLKKDKNTFTIRATATSADANVQLDCFKFSANL